MRGLRNTGFHGGWLRDGRTRRQGVLSVKHRGCNETNKYHPAQQSPQENDWLPENEDPHGLMESELTLVQHGTELR